MFPDYDFKAFGRIDIRYSDNAHSGDVAIFGDDHSFNIEVYSMGSVVFKLEDIGGLITIYSLDSIQEVQEEQLKFLPVPYKIFKTGLVEYIKYDKTEYFVKENLGAFFSTEYSAKYRTIIFTHPDKGSIRISLERPS